MPSQLEKTRLSPGDKAASAPVSPLSTPKPTRVKRTQTVDDSWLHRALEKTYSRRLPSDFADDNLDALSSKSYDSEATTYSESESSIGLPSCSPFKMNNQNVLASNPEESEVRERCASTGMVHQDSDMPLASAAMKKKEEQERHMSNHMIVNWLYHKKYPTINEAGDGDKMPSKEDDAAVFAVPDISELKIQTGNERMILQAAKTFGPMMKPRRKGKGFHYRELNNMVPMNW